MRFALVILLYCVVGALAAGSAQLNGHTWLDDEGNVIEAHGGGFLLDGGTYYWYGENNKVLNYTEHGFNCYSSKDLVSWHFEGEVVNQTTITYNQPGPYRLERPKVLFNDKTKKYVMWFHLDTPSFAYHLCGVAISDGPAEPFRFVHGVQADGYECGDVQLYKTEDGTGYLIRALAGAGIGISRLTDDFLNTTGISSKINEPLEGPALFKYNNSYHLLLSHRTGWLPNDMQYYEGGPDLANAKWELRGNPTGSKTSFDTQPTDVTIFGDMIIYQGDRWNSKGAGGLNNASYVWLPIIPTGNTFKIPYVDRWTN